MPAISHISWSEQGFETDSEVPIDQLDNCQVDRQTTQMESESRPDGDVGDPVN